MGAKLTYQDEENNLLYTMLDKRFYSVLRNPSHELWRSTSVELFLTSECNLACEYCYLHTRGDELYPKHARGKDAVKSNLHKIFEWWYREDFHINDLQLFSGEIWHLPYGHDVLQIILSYVQKGLKISYITLPTNSSFASTDEGISRMQSFVDAFQKEGCRLTISHSIEGLMLEDMSRPVKTGDFIRDQSFYDRVFAFAKKNTFYFHPMVAAANIEKWCENYDWFKDMCSKYDMPFPRCIMMLEVRNPDWTSEKLEYLKKYYKHQIDYYWELSNKDISVFIQKAFGISNSFENNEDMGYSNIAFPAAKTQASCSIPSTLTIRIGDLALVPCHRTAYPHFLYGSLVADEETVTGVTANNTQMAAKILYSNNLTSHHRCDVCPYNGVCMRCCYGEQYEETKEVFMPDHNVCNMFRAKYDFLIDTYDEMGVLKFLSEIPPSDVRYMSAQTMLNEVDRINEARCQKYV